MSLNVSDRQRAAQGARRFRWAAATGGAPAQRCGPQPSEHVCVKGMTTRRRNSYSEGGPASLIHIDLGYTIA